MEGVLLSEVEESVSGGVLPLGTVCVGECMVFGELSAFCGVLLYVAEKLSSGVRSDWVWSEVAAVVVIEVEKTVSDTDAVVCGVVAKCVIVVTVLGVEKEDDA